MRTLLCSLLLTRAAGLSVVTSRITARSELLDLLKISTSVAPLPVTGRVAELVYELELSAVLPETPAFLAFGLNGRWQLRALLGPDGLELPAAGLPLACLSPAAAHQLPHHAASQALEHRGANPNPRRARTCAAAGLPLAGVGLGVSEQRFELDPLTRAGGLCGRLVSSTDFTLREAEAEPLAGRLQSEAEVFLTSHANTLHLKAATLVER